MSNQTKQRILLGVNIDHIATIRQQRHTRYPDPVQAAIDAEEAGADGITVHLREDKRHIQPRDVELLSQVLQTRMNLEMAVTEDMLSFAERIRPEHVCFVPEKREELTTEGGLDVIGRKSMIRDAVMQMSNIDAEVSLFIDANHDQIDAAKEVGASVIEIHTGDYADAVSEVTRQQELARLSEAAQYAASIGLVVNAGHGLHYHNVAAVAEIPEFHELNIGHAIIARALFTGLKQAVKDMKNIMLRARNLSA